MIGPPRLKPVVRRERHMSKTITLTMCFVAAYLTSVKSQAPTRDPGTRPEIAESISPLERLIPIAYDGAPGLAFLRKPPGNGPFPAILLVHPGMTKLPEPALQEYAERAAPPSRFLAEGYVTVVLTYRSRDIDPQSKAPVDDVRAALDAVRRLRYVDPTSVGMYGC